MALAGQVGRNKLALFEREARAIHKLRRHCDCDLLQGYLWLRSAADWQAASSMNTLEHTVSSHIAGIQKKPTEQVLSTGALDMGKRLKFRQVLNFVLLDWNWLPCKMANHTNKNANQWEAAVTSCWRWRVPWHCRQGFSLPAFGLRFYDTLCVDLRPLMLLFTLQLMYRKWAN